MQKALQEIINQIDGIKVNWIMTIVSLEIIIKLFWWYLSILKHHRNNVKQNTSSNLVKISKSS